MGKATQRSGKKQRNEQSQKQEQNSSDNNATTKNTKPSKKSPKIQPTQRTNWQNVMLAKIGILTASFIITVLALVFYSEDPVTQMAAVDQGYERLVHEVKCSKDYDAEPFKSCIPKNCKRIVFDHMVTQEEAYHLLKVAKKGLALGGSAGGASILDLHSGALSKGNAFVNIYKVLEIQNENLFTLEDFTIYKRVKDKVFQAIINEFNIPHTKLYLTKPTFFSRMTTAPAKTVHDEYWHTHIDKVTYGSFHYTSLVYLSTYKKDFTGGRFMFVDGNTNRTVEPKVGRVSIFTSGSENPHFVEKVETGVRYAITVSFTCDPSLSIPDPAHL